MGDWGWILPWRKYHSRCTVVQRWVQTWSLDRLRCNVSLHKKQTIKSVRIQFQAIKFLIFSLFLLIRSNDPTILKLFSTTLLAAGRSLPILTTGQFRLHSCRHFLGLHLSSSTTATRLNLCAIYLRRGEAEKGRRRSELLALCTCFVFLLCFGVLNF